MGIILTRFKRKTTTLEVLENLETDIKHIEEYRLTTEQRHKTIVGHLILYSVGLYVLAAVVFYFYFFPASLSDQLFYITPLLIFPVIIVFLKRLVSWYYQRKIARNQIKLVDMRKQKKQLLEEVMDKETYKVAKEILEKFAPDQLRKSPVAVPARPGSETSPDPSARMLLHVAPLSTIPSGPSPNQSLVLPVGSNGAPMAGTVRRRGPVPRPPSVSPYQPRQNVSGQGFIARPPPGPPMPRPILPRERGVLDKLVEYIVGDGPGNRYALVCRQCESHNGMALKEEFEYFSFRCCYCYYWNPARKQRPQAPRLEQHSPAQTSASELESASSNTEDDDESEAEESDVASPSEPNLSAPVSPSEPGSLRKESGNGDDLGSAGEQGTLENAKSEGEQVAQETESGEQVAQETEHKEPEHPQQTTDL